MAELARDGGCLTADVLDSAALAASIYQLAIDAPLRARLSREAAARAVKTWDDYALGVLEALRGDRLAAQVRMSPACDPHRVNTAEWDPILYDGCIRAGWRMSDSERMALTGLLARHRPTCSIDVSASCGGSLSLIAQFSRIVFSIAKEPAVPALFANPENVSFLTGSSAVVLPHLFAELDRAGIPVDLILIDDDDSEEGLPGDIECLLRYTPRKPMFVLLHNSFNPARRRGLLAADWSASRYCRWVDLDFVPGRVTERGDCDAVELLGGLAAAYFHPSERSAPLDVRASASGMFEALSELPTMRAHDRSVPR
jgi:hypothetical protein